MVSWIYANISGPTSKSECAPLQYLKRIREIKTWPFGYPSKGLFGLSAISQQIPSAPATPQKASCQDF